MLEGKKREIVHPLMLLQIIQEARGPGNLTIRVGPNLDVFIYALKRWTAQFQIWIQPMQCRGPLDVQRGVIFGQHVLPIGFFTHLDVRNWISALLQISELSGSVVGSVVEQRHRNHAGQSACNSAGEK